uniref:Uncharacterized protein n=1 Tax=Setaria digitata TaxID=48799 RepID=A0A915PKS3_9BILA
MIRTASKGTKNKGVKSNRSNGLIRNIQLDVAEELRKQRREIERVDMALLFTEKMESNELEQDSKRSCKDPSLDNSYEFRGFREVHEELNQYMHLVQQLMNLRKGSHSDCTKNAYTADDLVGKAHNDYVNRIELDQNFTPNSTASSQQLTNSQMNHLAVIPTTTVHISPRLVDSVSKCCCGSSIYSKPKEVLVDARKSVQNQLVHSTSEPTSLMQLVQTSNLKPHPFLSQPGSDSHSLHAAVQTVLGSLKRTLPGFHATASAILKSDSADFVSAFAVALRRYDDRVRSQIKLLLEKYDSSVSSIRRSELVCEIDHLYKISRAASIKREQVFSFPFYLQLLDIIHGPYYQAVNCPPLRQMKILHTTFSSNPA